MNSPIEIYDSKGEKTVVNAPAGYEFTGELRKLRDGEYRWQQIGAGIAINSTPGFCGYGNWFILRPLPTAKEQRDNKLRGVLALTANRYTFSQTIAEIEAIFSPYLKEPEC